VALHIPRLRRWFAGVAIALTCLVATFYFYSRHRVQNALRQVPEKIGIEIQQSAKGFAISKSFQGHTLFKIEASKAVQFKEGGRGELHDVEITVYGRDAARFDRITGKDFEYDAITGDVIGKGEVHIDLESNPAGGGLPDQATPGSLKNPIDLKTTDLVFNQKTGDAHADGKVEFSIPQANGSALGLNYVAHASVLTLNSQVKAMLNALIPVEISANRLILSRTPRELVLDHPHFTEGPDHSDADKATVFLSQDNRLERVLVQGNVLVGSDRPYAGKITAMQLELLAGTGNVIREATLLGNVHFENFAEGGIQGRAGRAVLNFNRRNILGDVHADRGVNLTQPADTKTSSAQGFELTAPAMDFHLSDGRILRRAETIGVPQITISSIDTSVSNKKTGSDTTVITAGKFEAIFDNKGQIVAVHGGPDSRVTTKAPGKTDRVSTSQTIDAEFAGGKGITALVQKGNFAYNDGEIKAWANTARYTAQDQMLALEGSPRIADGGMTTTAQTVRLNRLTGTAYADGDVKTTDTSFQRQTGKNRLPPGSPIHVTAAHMLANRSPAAILYTGNVRVWQDASSVEGPSVEFHRDRKTVTAEGNEGQRVSAALAQTDKKGRILPVVIAADRLTYSEDQRIIHFEGDVVAVSKDLNLTAAKMDCFLIDRTQVLPNPTLAKRSSLEKVVGAGGVVITEPGRRVTGSQLVYTVSEDKFVMTGGPPSIFDAEHGNVTGDSLTLYGHDARVLVEGSKQSPAVTEIRVAR
jgi:lipopolysaccharide export system protein LptA